MKRLARILTNIFFKLFFRVNVIDVDKVPSEGGAIICANHNSMLDMFFLGFKLKRWIHWMAKEELFRNPILALIITKLGAFPVKRGSGDTGPIKQSYKILEDGELLGIFPHGTRISPSRFERKKVKPGAALIAMTAGVPIVPVYIQGNYKIFSKMNVIYGDPYTIETQEDKRYTREELKELSREIVKKIYSLAEVVS